jgi:hypothetical protein
LIDLSVIKKSILFYIFPNSKFKSTPSVYFGFGMSDVCGQFPAEIRHHKSEIALLCLFVSHNVRFSDKLYVKTVIMAEKTAWHFV